MTRPSPHIVLLGAILILATAVRFWGLGFGLPHTQARPDETFIIGVALRFLDGRFSPDFYDYPTLYMFLLTGLYLLYFALGAVSGRFGSLPELVESWPVDWAPFFLLSRALSAVFGSLSVLVTYLLATRLFDRVTGLTAALLLALAFLHVRDSHFGTTDVALGFFVLASLLFLVQAHADGRPRHFVAAGALAGLATATKYNGVLVGSVLLVSLALRLRAAPAGRVLREPVRRAALYGLPFAAAFIVAAPFVLLEFDRFLAAMELLRESMAVGMTPGEVESGWRYHLAVSLRYGVGWPMLAAGLAGIAWMAWRDWQRALLLTTFPAVYFAIAGASQNVFVRYMVPIVPFVCIAAGWALVALTRALPPRVPERARPLMLTAAALIVIFPSGLQVAQFNRVLASEDTRVEAARWLDETLPDGASLLQAGSHYGHAHPTRWRGLRLWTWERALLIFVVDGRPATGRPDWIVVQDSPLPYSPPQPIVEEYLREGYMLVHMIRGHDARAHRNVYDRQDAFFVPFGGFEGVRQPGPNFLFYRRVGR